MIIDSILTWITNFIVWVINLFPATPDFGSAKTSFATLVSYLNSSFIPVTTLISVLGIVLGFYLALKLFWLIKTIINLIRGAGA